MARLVGYCGLICTDCPAYVATQKNDDVLRKETADMWAKRYGNALKPEDINCDGCVSAGRHVGHCSVCEVRLCGQEKGVVNCAYCREYACAKLDKYLHMSPVMKANLEEIRKGLK